MKLIFNISLMIFAALVASGDILADTVTLQLGDSITLGDTTVSCGYTSASTCNYIDGNVYCGIGCQYLDGNVYCDSQMGGACSYLDGNVYCGVSCQYLDGNVYCGQNCAYLDGNVYCGDTGLASPAAPAVPAVPAIPAAPARPAS